MSTSTGVVGMDDGELTSQSVVAAVAAETGTDPLTLEPLYEVLDPDALDALFDANESEAASAVTRVEFTYAGCEVCVTGTGSVDVTALAD